MPTLCAHLCSHLCSHLGSRSPVTLLDSEDSDGLERPELHGKSGEVDGWDARAQASIGLPLSSRVSVVSHVCPHLSYAPLCQTSLSTPLCTLLCSHLSAHTSMCGPQLYSVVMDDFSMAKV